MTDFYGYDFEDGGIYVSLNPVQKTEEEINEALDTINITGQDLVYTLSVNGKDAGTINIPEDQFLDEVSYDSETKELVFKIKGGGEVRVYIGDFIGDIPTKLSQLENDMNFITEESLEGYAKVEDVYTKAEVDEVVAAKADSADVYTKEEVDEKLAVKADADAVYTKEAVDEALAVKADSTDVYTKAEVDEAVAVKADAETVYTKEEVDEKIEPLAVKADVDEAISAKADADAVYTKEEVDEKFVGNATQEWVEAQGYLTEHQDISNLATKEEVAEEAERAQGAEETLAEADASIKENAVFGAEYVKADNKIYLKNEAGATVAEIDTTDFVKDGMIDEVKVENGNLVIVFNTDSGKETISIPLTEFFNPDNYYTKAELDEVLATKANAEDVYTKAEVSDVLATKADAEDVYTKEEVDEKFVGNATQEWVEAQGYLTEHQDISDLATKEELAAEAARATAAEEAVDGKVDDLDAAVKAGYVASAEYVKADKKIYLKNGNAEAISEIDVTDFVKDGMIDNVVVENGNLVITFNTDSGKETITIPLTEFFNPDNYYTKADIDATLEGYATKTEMTNSDNNVKRSILSKIWSNPNDEDKGYFQTKYTSANGSYALMFNESDGGGSQYFNSTDNIISYVGVNDGGANDVCVQIYSKDKATNIGSRLNVNPNGMFYAVSGSASTAAERELAVKEDIAADRAEVDAIIAEKDATITKLNNDLYNLKKVVGDMGGAVTYDLPADGKSFNTLMSNNGTVKLSEDVSTGRYGPGMMASNATTLNINNRNLTITGLTEESSQAGIMARGTQNITITGKGTIDSGEGINIETNGASAVINLTGGTTVYHNNRPGGELVYCYAGTINITGGTFRNYGESNYVLNCYDANYQAGTAKIIVSSTSTSSGPKFYDFNPADNLAEGPNTNFVAEGCHVTSTVVVEDEVEHTIYTVVKDA